MRREDPVTAFDQIAPVYDETREPIDARALEGLCRILSLEGASSILEVGVGTGRVAIPLQARGFVVTGLDGSRSMISLARSKGVSRLVMGNAYRMPFRNSSFDHALFVDVLGLLEDPDAALREAARVNRRGTLALLQHHVRLGTGGEDREQVRALMHEVLAELGFPLLPPRPGTNREEALLERWPPDRRTVLIVIDLEESPEKRLEMFEKRADRTLLDVPPDLLAKALPLVRARLSGQKIRFRRTYMLAEWTANK